MRLVNGKDAGTNLVNLKPVIRGWNPLQLSVGGTGQALTPLWLLGEQRRDQTDCEEYTDGSHGLARNSDTPFILALPLQSNFHISFALQRRKLLSPLDQQNAALRTQVIQSERFEFPRSVDAIQVDVVNIGAWPAILVHQGEGGTGNVFLGSGLEGRCDSFNQRSFACAEIATQQHYLGWGKKCCQRTPEGNRFLRRMGGDFPRRGFCFGLSVHSSSIATGLFPEALSVFARTQYVENALDFS